MSSETIAQYIETVVMMGAGLWIWAIGFRLIGKKPGESIKYDAWHDRYGRFFRYGGPIVMLSGMVTLLAWQLSPPPPGTYSSTAAHWQEVLSPDGKCRVRLPGTPVRRDTEMPEGAGRIDSFHLTRFDHKVSYILSHSNLPDEAAQSDPSLVLDVVRDQVVSDGKSGRLVQESPLSFGEIAGRELVLEYPSGYRVMLKCLVMRGRIYRLVVTAPSSEFDSSEVQRVLDSLSVVQ
jgi:hypothetical protein